ncbi:hypothetical protein VNO80_06764 [Phaseolus coccineus]|uniref:Uncharacterized protein n=1 Tax=Phaseolus coccineus TaxID=3886 RepID=A0AAN9NPC8_PHACN
MALGISNILHCPKLSFSHNNLCPKISTSQTAAWSDRKIICVAASVAGSSNLDGDFNPYEVLGVTPIEKFDMVKATYAKRKKEAEMNGDEAIASRKEDEDTGEGLRMGKRLLRSLALVFGCVAITSLAYTFVLNIIEFAGGFIPALLYNNQLRDE